VLGKLPGTNSESNGQDAAWQWELEGGAWDGWWCEWGVVSPGGVTVGDMMASTVSVVGGVK
jgi:hypothetical protein